MAMDDIEASSECYRELDSNQPCWCVDLTRISIQILITATVGMCIGVTAALISIITEWLSDIKMGYCSDGWWLNQQFCCWEIEGDEEACDSWHPWSTVSLGRWFIYVMFAVSDKILVFKGV